MRRVMERAGAVALLFVTEASAMGQSPAGGQAQGGLGAMLVPLALMFGVLYLFMIRPAQKKQKDKDRMLSALKKGDRIVTSGGIYGDIQNVKDNTVILRVADSVKIEIQRSSIGAVVTAADDEAEVVENSPNES